MVPARYTRYLHSRAQVRFLRRAVCSNTVSVRLDGCLWFLCPPRTAAGAPPAPAAGPRHFPGRKDLSMRTPPSPAFGRRAEEAAP